MIKHIVGTIIGVILAVALIGAASSRMGAEESSPAKNLAPASECSELFTNDVFTQGIEVD